MQAVKRTPLVALVIFALVCAVGLSTAAFPDTAHAAKAGKKVYFHNSKGKVFKDTVIGVYNKKGQIVYKPATKKLAKRHGITVAQCNYNSINYLVKGKKKKTIVFPKKTIKLSGPILPGNNTTLISNGTTFVFPDRTNAIWVKPKKTNYKSFKNLTIIGGTFKTSKKAGTKGSMISLAHGSNIVIDGVTASANYSGHAIEIIACKNVVVRNSTAFAVGTCPSDCKEAQIQIDLALKATAPKVAKAGKKYVQGQTCQNVKIQNCTVKGARGIEANWYHKDGGKWQSKYHDAITIEGCKVETTTSEAIGLFNTVNATVRNTTAITHATRTASNNSYTIGLHIENHVASSVMTKGSYVIENNVVKGKRNGMYIKGGYGKMVVRNNTFAAKSTEASAYKLDCSFTGQFTDTGNKRQVW